MSTEKNFVEKLTDEQTLKLLSHLFRILCDDENVPPEMRERILPSYFASWFNEYIVTHAPDGNEICEKLHVEISTWDFVRELCRRSDVVECLALVWLAVCMCDRAKPTIPLRSISTTMLFRWEDGTITPISMYLSPPQNNEMTDGVIASSIRMQILGFIDVLRRQGLDGLYKGNGQNFGGDAPFKVLIGGMIKTLSEISLDVRPYCEKYLRLIQCIFSEPPQIKASKKQNKPAEESGLRGGWDG